MNDFYADYPISIKLVGNYHDLGFFFDKIRRYRRVINVSGLQIRHLTSSGGEDRVQAECVATTYVNLEKEAEE